ncbi:MAG: nucleotidyltransferase domain-containing protein [Nanoarchaeota archaeon]
MEIIAKISKGSNMDQVYLPKNRIGFDIGNYVLIKPFEKKITQTEQTSYFYGIKSISPIKLEIIKKIIETISKSVENYENIIITGSFLDEEFNFNDIDVIIVSDEKENIKEIENNILKKLKIKTHIIFFNKNSFIEALKIDPRWRLMLNRCISRKRLQPLSARKINYKYLDAQLIKSKILIDNFDYLTGKEKYKLTRNLIAIYLFIENKTLSEENIEREIRKKLSIEVGDLKNNLINKNFFKKYKNFYLKLEKETIKNATKQE